MVAIIKTLSLGAQRRKSAFASLCFMKWKMLVLRYGVACTPVVKCRFTAPALGRGAAPICGRSIATQHGIRHPGAQPEHAPIRHTLTPSNTTGEQSGPAASQEYRLSGSKYFLLTFLRTMACISHDSEWVWSFVLVLSKTILWELFVLIGTEVRLFPKRCRKL